MGWLEWQALFPACERNAELFTEGFQHLSGLGVTYAAAADHQRPSAFGNHLYQLIQILLHRKGPADSVHSLLEEILREIIGLAFHILGQSDTYRAGLLRIGQHAHGLYHGGHKLFRTEDSFPETADRTERIVRRNGKRIHSFHLLKHRVGLSAGIGISGEQKQRDTVHRCACGRRHHVRRARSDGGSAGDDPAAVALSGKAGRHVSHALFVASLIYL